MPIQSRPYAGDADLEKIKGLLMAGRAASPHSGYMHLGDLAFRLYESVGFRVVNTFCGYDKPIEE